MTTGIIWQLRHGRGSPYLDALRTASRAELETAREEIRKYNDADFPMDAGRRLDQIADALLDRDLADACRSLLEGIRSALHPGEDDAPEVPHEVREAVPRVLAMLAGALEGGGREALLAAGEAAAEWIWKSATEDERLEWITGMPEPTRQRFEDVAERIRGDDAE